MAGETSPSTLSHSTYWRRMVPILPAIVVGLASFAWLDHVNPAFVAWDDGIRDQLMARDCTDLGHCHQIGAPASVRNLFQGAVWIDFLVAGRLLGSDTSTERTMVFLLLGLSAATTFIVVWRWLRPSLAFPATVLYVTMLSFDTYPSLLTNASVVAFPAVLVAAGLLCYGLSGRRLFLLFAAFAVGVGINVHVATLSLVPSLVAIAVLARPRPWASLLAALALLVLVCFLSSSGALSANIIDLAERANPALVLGGGVISVVLIALLGPWYRRLTWSARACIVGIVMTLPLGLASLWLVVAKGHHFSYFYLHPIFAPLAVLAGATLCIPFEVLARRRRALAWIPTAALLAVVAYLTVYEGKNAIFATPGPPHWTLAESGAIFEWAAERDWTYEDLLFHVQGNSCRELLAGMSVIAPPPHGLRRDDHRQLQVVKLGREEATELEDGDGIIRVGARPVAYVREVDSWLRPKSLRACLAPLDPAHPATCSNAILPPAELLTPERFLFVLRTYPQIHDRDLPKPYVATYEIPLQPAAGETRELSVLDTDLPQCGWQMTRVEGIEIDARLPARRLRLHSTTGDRAVLVIERQWGVDPCSSLDDHYPPCVLETLPGDRIQAIAGTDR